MTAASKAALPGGAATNVPWLTRSVVSLIFHAVPTRFSVMPASSGWLVPPGFALFVMSSRPNASTPALPPDSAVTAIFCTTACCTVFALRADALSARSAAS